MAIATIVILIFGYAMGLIRLPGESLQPVPAPSVNNKIKGYWSSQSGRVLSELNDAEKMKEMGINTITFSPMLTHDQEGRVSEIAGTENYVKKAINKAHKNGLRVMLETTPMNAGKVDPKVKNPGLFQKEMTRISLKYAKIAEDYNVEYFAPIVEGECHMGVVENEKWLRELLPKLKAVYHGKIMWKKQSTDLDQPKDWKEDHIFIIGFKFDGNEFTIKLKEQAEQSISLRISSDGLNLEKYAKTNQIFRESKNYLLSGGWHELKIEIKGKLITVSIDNEKLMEKLDDSGPLGGYLLRGKVRINKLEILDMNSQVLYKETFDNLNSFSAQKGEMALEGKELIADSEIKLIHDINFSGYDYIAVNTFRFPKALSTEEYMDYLRHVIQKTNDQAKSDGVPNVILSEFGGALEAVHWAGEKESTISFTEDELVKTVKMVLELAEKSMDGYIYNGWDIEKQGLNKLPKVQAVVKEWYITH